MQVLLANGKAHIMLMFLIVCALIVVAFPLLMLLAVASAYVIGFLIVVALVLLAVFVGSDFVTFAIAEVQLWGATQYGEAVAGIAFLVFFVGFMYMLIVRPDIPDSKAASAAYEKQKYRDRGMPGIVKIILGIIAASAILPLFG